MTVHAHLPAGLVGTATLTSCGVVPVLTGEHKGTEMYSALATIVTPVEHAGKTIACCIPLRATAAATASENRMKIWNELRKLGADLEYLERKGEKECCACFQRAIDKGEKITTGFRSWESNYRSIEKEPKVCVEWTGLADEPYLSDEAKQMEQETEREIECRVQEARTDRMNRSHQVVKLLNESWVLMWKIRYYDTLSLVEGVTKEDAIDRWRKWLKERGVDASDLCPDSIKQVVCNVVK